MAVSEKYSNFSKKRPHRGLLGKTISSNAKQWALFLACDLVDQASPAYGYTAMDVNSLTNDVLIYADEALTEPLVPAEGSLTTFYYYDSGYLNSCSFDCSPGDATIANFAQCYLQWEGYLDCEGTTPITVFTKYLYNGSPVGALSIGLQLFTVYTSGNLESVFPYATFVTLSPTVGWEIGNVGSGIITGTGGCPI